jgi:hypothetical protein
MSSLFTWPLTASGSVVLVDDKDLPRVGSDIGVSSEWVDFLVILIGLPNSEI